MTIRWTFVAGTPPTLTTGHGGKLEATKPLSQRAPWRCARCRKLSPPIHAVDDVAAIDAFAEFAQAHAGKECR